VDTKKLVKQAPELAAAALKLASSSMASTDNDTQVMVARTKDLLAAIADGRLVVRPRSVPKLPE
jgi:hypothetical protein